MAGFQIPHPCGLSQLPTDTVSGVYFLWQADTIVYVGQSRHVTQRIFQHVEERLKTFDGMSWIPVEIRRLSRLEAYFIQTLLPRYNRCGLSEKARRERPWGEQPPLTLRLDRTGAAEYLGLTLEQFASIHVGSQPRTVRLPRQRTRVYRTEHLWQWKLDNSALLERLKR